MAVLVHVLGMTCECDLCIVQMALPACMAGKHLDLCIMSRCHTQPKLMTVSDGHHVSTASVHVYPLCKRRFIFSRNWDQLHVVIVMGQQHTEDFRLSRSC